MSNAHNSFNRESSKFNLRSKRYNTETPVQDFKTSHPPTLGFETILTTVLHVFSLDAANIGKRLSTNRVIQVNFA